MSIENDKQLIKFLSKKDLNNYSNLKDIFDVVLNIYFENEQELKYCLGITDYLKKQSQYLLIKTQDQIFEKLYYDVVLFEAQHLFDSYLIYLEKNRLEKDRFYLPKRKHLIRHGIIQVAQDLEDDVIDIASISMPPGTQKAQPLYSKVLTLNGWIRMGDVKVGTIVISGTGKLARVTGVFPQGIKPIYELTFDDGSKCRCSDEHLWTVQTRKDRKNGKYRTITLNEMLKDYRIGNGTEYNYSIDYVSKIDFEPIEYFDFSELKKINFKQNIPEKYLFASYEQRKMVADYILNNYCIKVGKYQLFSLINTDVANDFVELIHSLGGFAKLDKENGENFVKTILNSDKERKRFLIDVKFIGNEECQCIYIDDPSHLYITDNYIITHNTTFEKFFASWVIGRHPDDYSLFYSHSDDITRMFYDGVLSITTDSSEYTWNEIFPNVSFHSTNAKRQTINFNKTKSFANLQCTSVGAKNAGKVRCNRYLYCDDLIGGIEEAMNKTRLDKLWSIYGVDAKQRKLDGCKELHVATRWSVHDIIGRIQNLYEKGERTRFIAIPDIDPITGKSNFDYQYNGFSVAFFNDQALSMDDISYRCLYKNEPIEREGLLYTEDDLRRYLTLPTREPDAILGICDTKNKGTDYLFLPCLAQYGDDYYCIDCICDDNSDYGVQYERVSDLIVRNKMQAVEFESNNGGDRVAFEVNKRVEEKGWTCNITEKPTESNKETKIMINAHWVKKHVIFKDKSLYRTQDDYGIMMQFLLSYSVKGKNKHDDVPDGFACFALYTQRLGGGKVQVISNPLWGGR